MAVLGRRGLGHGFSPSRCRRWARRTIWARERDAVESINNQSENALFLPGIKLNAAVRATGEIADAAKSQLILAVSPAQHMRSVLRAVRPHLRPGAPLVLCAKGVERGSLALMTEVLAEEIPGIGPAVLSGPGFARMSPAVCPRPRPSPAPTSAPPSASSHHRAADVRPYVADDLIGRRSAAR